MPTSFKLYFKKFSEFDLKESADIFDSTDKEQNIKNNYYVVGYYNDGTDNTINYRIPLSDLSTAIRKHLHVEYEMHDNDGITEPSKGEIVENAGYDDGQIRIDKIHLFPVQNTNEDDPNSPDNNLMNSYNEWIIVSKGDKYYWEPLGQAKIDLSDYTKVDALEVDINDEWKISSNGNVERYYKLFNPTQYPELANKKIKDILRIEEKWDDGGTIKTEIVVPNLIVIGPDDSEFSIDMTMKDIYGNISWPLTNGRKLRITMLYTFKKETVQTS